MGYGAKVLVSHCSFIFDSGPLWPRVKVKKIELRMHAYEPISQQEDIKQQFICSAWPGLMFDLIFSFYPMNGSNLYIRYIIKMLKGPS